MISGAIYRIVPIEYNTYRRKKGKLLIMNELDCVRNIIYEAVQFQKLLLHEKMTNRDVGDTQHTILLHDTYRLHR